MPEGFLTIKLFAADQALPVGMMNVLVKDMAGTLLYELVTDENGLTRKVTLSAPDYRSTLDPNSTAERFSIYDVEIPRAKGYKKSIIHGVQIFDTESSILPVQLHTEIPGEPPDANVDEVFIPKEHGVDLPHQTQTLPPLTENRIDGGNNGSSGNNGGSSWSGNGSFNAGTGIESTQVVAANDIAIPEYITVHLGSPNAAAQNVRVPFIDYIKNVASSEIFPNWNEAALYANIYCQISFALNRVYTVWYRSRGFDFDITNSTAFDQYFVYGRNIFENISRIVDGIFNIFIRRQGRQEPFFAQYCNGTTVTCAGLSQWGSQDLALRGFSAMQILLYYFPNDIRLSESNNFTTQVGTYPGTPLRIGSSGANVRLMQNYLNRIGGSFYIPAIPNPDGVFGTMTENSTKRFQEINFLVPDGIIGKNTWYSITKIYVAVARLAELDSEGERIGIGAAPPTVTVQVGSRGEYVVELQFLINFISEFFPSIPFVVQSGVFRDDTKRGVIEFQKEFGLTPDGIVGPATWQKLYTVYNSIKGSSELPGPPYPGFNLQLGSRGDDVLRMQNYLNDISVIFPVVPGLTADGVFGARTRDSVMAFQRFFGLTPDGIIGRNTWDRIVSVHEHMPDIVTPVFPGVSLRNGSRGNDVLLMQRYLNTIARQYPAVPTITADGVFGPNTENAVRAFQNQFGLTNDGIIGRNTWNMIVSVNNLLQASALGIASNEEVMREISEGSTDNFPEISPLSGEITSEGFRYTNNRTGNNQMLMLLLMSMGMTRRYY